MCAPHYFYTPKHQPACDVFAIAPRPRTLRTLLLSKGTFVLVEAAAASAVPGGGGREGGRFAASPCLVARSTSLAKQST